MLNFAKYFLFANLYNDVRWITLISFILNVKATKKYIQFGHNIL